MGFWESDLWQWWLKYGFDGLAGGVIGGAVTGGAVWVTLRHERKIREEDRKDARVDALYHALTRLQLAFGDFHPPSKVTSDPVVIDELGRALSRVRAEILIAEATAKSVSREVTVALLKLRMDLTQLTGTKNWHMTGAGRAFKLDSQQKVTALSKTLLEE